jgi:23S rRNA pseudouridine1911/1915/1917 synthase
MTMYELVERFDGFAHVRVKPKTGRTHQIRVHMANAGSPVLCDRLYSGRAKLTVGDLNRTDDETMLLDRQALHAYRIVFDHPESGERTELMAPLADDMVRALEVLSRDRPLS